MKDGNEDRTAVAPVEVERLVMRDCRTCKMFVGLGDPCMSTFTCNMGLLYQSTTPVQQWRRNCPDCGGPLSGILGWPGDQGGPDYVKCLADCGHDVC